MVETPNPNGQSPQELLMGIAMGYMLSRALHVAADMGIADLLSEGPQTVDELAKATGAQPQSLYRLTRMLAASGIFADDLPGRFDLTPAAALLRSRVACSLRDAVRLAGDITGEGNWWNLWTDLERCVMTGQAGIRSRLRNGLLFASGGHSRCKPMVVQGRGEFRRGRKRCDRREL